MIQHGFECGQEIAKKRVVCVALVRRRGLWLVGNREECAKSRQEVGRSGVGHLERTAKPENEAMYREGSMERQEHYHGPKAWESSVRRMKQSDE
mmetsp:Transcript_24972/g.29508  ORF Transcript_24972/g.29508 Transcript_24972/m.29508 type:complete len:94 (-) Transcript_24972:1535-1816(-)